MNGKGANLFELAGEHVDYAFLLCLVGIYEVLLTLVAAAAAGGGESSYGRGKRHEDSKGDDSILL
jgi:hypothetical protein